MEHSDYIKKEAKLALTLQDLALEAAEAKNWERYAVLRAHIDERSPYAILTLAREILGDDE